MSPCGCIRHKEAVMEIILAKNIGFCFGVKRAIGITLKALRENPGVPIYMLGPLIHNPPVIKELENKGVNVVYSPAKVNKGILIVPSHGLALSVIKVLNKKGVRLLDATCPNVLMSQKLASSLAADGYRVIVFGQKFHPEIKGIMGRIGRAAKLVSSLDDIKRIPRFKKLGVIAQTTESLTRFRDVVADLVEKGFETKVYNTLCAHTRRRQEEAAKIAGNVDVMIVAGGHNSANTSRLYELCRKIVPACHVESAEDLDSVMRRKKIFSAKARVGIVSGTSTPDSSIKDIVKRLKASRKNRGVSGNG